MGNKPPRWNDEVGLCAAMGQGASHSRLGRFGETAHAASWTKRTTMGCGALAPLWVQTGDSWAAALLAWGPKLLCGTTERAPRHRWRNHYASCRCRPC